MKNRIYIPLTIMALSFLLISCGASKITEGDMDLDQSDYTPALTEEEQVKESEADKEFYKQAKAEGDPTLCEKINFTDLKKLCLKKAAEGPQGQIGEEQEAKGEEESIVEAD